MSIYSWLAAVLLALGFTFAHSKAALIVQRLSGRESRPEPSGFSAELFSLVFFGLALGIGLPPIYLLPEPDPLIHCLFFLVGMTSGSLAAQALFGRKVAG